MEDIIAIAAGSDDNGTTLAVRNDGTVWAWGYNYYGQLGNGSTTNCYTPIQVLTAIGTPLTGVTEAASSGYHSVARTTDGKIYTWGANWYGQLGDSSIIDSSYAEEINF